MLEKYYENGKKSYIFNFNFCKKYNINPTK